MPQQTKLAIIGAGAVGTTIAYACMVRGVARHIALYDLNRAKVEAETLDLNHGLQFVPPAAIEGSDDIAVCRDASIIVITAGAKQKPGQTRMELAAVNADICRKLVPGLVALAPAAILLVVTNPVDVMTHVTLKLSGLPSARVFGSGTVLDSSRFRFLIARRCNVAVQNVHAYIAGEHGDSEIPLWSSATIGNIPLGQWAVSGHGRLSAQDREQIVQGVKGAAYQIIQGKGATNYAVGLATARILEAIVHDENRVLPVSSLLRDYAPCGGRGQPITDVCLSVPCIINRGGVDAQLAVAMDEAEEAGLRSSAQAVRAAIGALGF
jgi:L-lactate dehydrogenase